MKKYRETILKFVLFILLSILAMPVFAQSGVGANFGIEADTRSGDVISGVLTDDWFFKFGVYLVQHEIWPRLYQPEFK